MRRCAVVDVGSWSALLLLAACNSQVHRLQAGPVDGAVAVEGCVVNARVSPIYSALATINKPAANLIDIVGLWDPLFQAGGVRNNSEV